MGLTETQPLTPKASYYRAKFSVSNKTDIPKILLIKLGAIGDLVLASSFFDQLRSNFPHSEIVLVLGRSSYTAVENNPNINRLILADDYVLYHGGLWLRSLECLRLIYKLRKESFDMAFVLHRAWPFNLLAYLVNIPMRVGFGRGHEGMFLTHPTEVHPVQNERESYLDLLRNVNLPAVYERTYYYLSGEEKRFLPLFLERYDIAPEEEVIILAPGGGDNAKSTMITKRWPVENYIELINKFQEERQCRIILAGGPSDRMITKKIMQSCIGCIDATDLSFGDMASLFRRCSLFVGNDSAPNHIAASIGIPCIGIWGPTDPRQWAPPDRNSNVIIHEGIECHPCFKDGRFPHCSHIKCMTSITVDHVWNRAKALLQEEIFEQPKT